MRWQALLPLAAVPAAMLIIMPRDEVPYGGFRVDVLDVGQGTAVVVRTHGHTLVYDTGARFSERFDAGASVVLPFLLDAGIDRLDRVVISHGDNDHSGGARSLLAHYRDAEVIGPRTVDVGRQAIIPCSGGHHWDWDGVDFRVLHPLPGFTGDENDMSCVVRIASAAGSALLTGDIGSRAEAHLLRSWSPELLDSELLLVPHHGSKTSSSTSFIDAVSPEYAVITAGYRNRYRLPAGAVIDRYREAGIETIITGHSGSTRFSFLPGDGLPVPRRYRDEQRRYWFHRP